MRQQKQQQYKLQQRQQVWHHDMAPAAKEVAIGRLMQLLKWFLIKTINNFNTDRRRAQLATDTAAGWLDGRLVG